MSQSSAEFTLRYALRALKRRLPIFVLCIVLVPAATVIVSLLQSKKYTATATLLFRDPQFDQKLFGNSFVQSQTDPAREAATNVDLVTLQRVAAITAGRLHHITADRVSSNISASGKGQSDLVSIDGTGSTPRFAARLANTFADSFIIFRRDADRTKIISAEVPLRRQIASLSPAQRNGTFGQSLQQRLSQLSALASLQTGNAELVQPAVLPTSPSSPKPIRNGAFGLFFGLLIGIALVVLAEALDRRLRDSDEVQQIFSRPLLAALPRSTALSRADRALLSIPAADREAFRMLWVNLRYFSLSRNIRSLLVTSADREDGKSTISWGLAVAAAAAGPRTLLVEADLRNPTFERRFNIDSSGGLTNVLAGDVSRAEATTRVPLPLNEDDAKPDRAMDVLLAGPRPPDPTDLLQSPRMAEFLREVEQEYDLVIVDTPPAATVSDAIPLITMVQGVVVVSRLGNTIREHSRRLRHQLDHLEAPVLGLVVNAVEGADPYGYGYGYGYGYERPPLPPKPRVEAPPARTQDEPAPTKTEEQPAPAAATAASDEPVPPNPRRSEEPVPFAEPNARSNADRPAAAGAWQPRQVERSVGDRNGAAAPIPARRRRLRDWLRY